MVFFGGYFLYDILIGTAALVVALIIQIIVYFSLRLEVTKQMWVFVGIGVTFGVITLLLDDDIFIKLRPAVVSAFIIVVVLVMQFVAKINLLQKMLGRYMQMEERAWRGLTYIVLGCMAFNAILNVFIAFTLSSDFWMGYRMVSAVISPCTILLLSYLYIRTTKQKVEFLDPDTQSKKTS